MTQFTLLFEEHFVKLLKSAKAALASEPDGGEFAQGDVKVVMDRWGWADVEQAVEQGLYRNGPEDYEGFLDLGWVERLFMYRQEWARRLRSLGVRPLFVDWDEDPMGSYDTVQWIVLPASAAKSRSA